LDVSLFDLCLHKRERSDGTKTSWRWSKSKTAYRRQLEKRRGHKWDSEKEEMKIAAGLKVPKLPNTP